MSFPEVRNHRRTKAWRRTDKDMKMVFIGFHRQERQPMLLAALSDQAFRFLLDFPSQHTATVLRYPDEVIGNPLVGIPRFPHLQNRLIHVSIIA